MLFLILAGGALPLFLSNRQNTVFRQLSLKEKDVVRIQLRYDIDEENWTSVSIDKKTEENTPFDYLIQFLDCLIKKVDIPVELYSADQLTAKVTTKDTEIELRFITTEGKNQTDSRLY